MSTVLDHINVAKKAVKTASKASAKADPGQALGEVFKSYPSVQALIDELMAFVPKALEASHNALDLIDAKAVDEGVKQATAGNKNASASINPVDLDKLSSTIGQLSDLVDISPIIDKLEAVVKDQGLISDMRKRYAEIPEKMDVSLVRNALTKVDLDKVNVVHQVGVLSKALAAANVSIHADAKGAVHQLVTELGGINDTLRTHVRRTIQLVDHLVVSVFG